MSENSKIVVTDADRPIKSQSEFREGDEVVLITGSYQGTPGVFLRLKEDRNWADITERDGSVRSHPIQWLGHAVVGS